MLVFRLNLWNSKEFIVSFQIFFEQIGSQEIVADCLWQFFKELFVELPVHSMHVFVVVPPVLKVLFNICLHFRIEVIGIVEVLEEPEESRKLFAIPMSFVLQPFLHHLDELAHNVREESYAKEKPESDK